MTTKERAKALYDVMIVQERTKAERLAAWDEMAETIKKSKSSFKALTGSQLDFKLLRQEIEALEDFEMSEEELAQQKGRAKEDDPLDEPAAVTLAKAEDAVKLTKPIVEAQKAGEPLPKESRGLITAEVKRLLLTDMPYGEIEAAVKAKHPEAKTTTRSIASTASDMRKAKLAVPQRRVEAAK